MLKFDDLFNVNLAKFMYIQMNNFSLVTLPIDLLPNNAVHSDKTDNPTSAVNSATLL